MKIHFTASRSPRAQQSQTDLVKRYGHVMKNEADIIVALGGDGHVLRTLYEAMELGKPVYAMRRTESVGFLCNDYADDNLLPHLQAASRTVLHPLRLQAETADGASHTAWAINEITVLRDGPQAARLRLSVDGVERLASYSGDGILVSTPAGSTAYNHSCGGPIMPLDSNTLVATAICGYRPRGWRYAVLPQTAAVAIDVLETTKRPVRIEAGIAVIANAINARINLDLTRSITLLFDPDQHLGERIIREQFLL